VKIRRLRMKKRGMICIAIVLLLAGLPVFAQESSGAAKDAYVKSVPLIKVWIHQLGYVLQFWNSHSQIQEIYVPLTWFNRGPASKADIVYGNDRSYPYCSIFWVDGKFDHLRLYVFSDYNSPTWGVMGATTDMDKSFDVQDIPKEF
jgi:hypothetical protein